jgi:hypothetical protein
VTGLYNIGIVFSVSYELTLYIYIYIYI